MFLYHCNQLTLVLFLSSSLPVEFLYCDLASMKSIREFVQQFRAKNCPLHVLVNNGEFWLFFHISAGEDVTNGAVFYHFTFQSCFLNQMVGYNMAALIGMSVQELHCFFFLRDCQIVSWTLVQLQLVMLYSSAVFFSSPALKIIWLHEYRSTLNKAFS